VAEIFIAAAQRHGTPASVLTDIHSEFRLDRGSVVQLAA